ncbi:helix-turn-helix transcriptional regulator [Kroppenstedtia pulmonis]|uniref:Helix-turn-helix transcriptional regulator n=1 Tax=Kroppenstedtia pulmonis TaxID=1380685 RepID=A0A7D3XPN4_9BACL|nr:AraC family transcriptional regulator [Kroppenstedtia pulmonis]QKG83642.1 helix-turn-helix transcriptional regulator [Kroppenstedtia pulmonis]
MAVKDLIPEMIEYIEFNPEQELSLDTIADQFGYSKFHLNRLFAANVGVTIYKYIQLRRLSSAAEKLVTTNQPIIEIAYDTGYQSQQAFSIAFRQFYGYTPMEYRHMGVFTPLLKRFTTQHMMMAIPSYANISTSLAA